MNREEKLIKILHNESDIEFAALVGSRANDTANPGSDWDIALQWNPQLDWLQVIEKTETFRRKLAKAINVGTDQIDLIELRRANLAMRANAAENGISLKGMDSLAWAHFLTRTWRELEYYYWEQSHAA